MNTDVKFIWTKDKKYIDIYFELVKEKYYKAFNVKKFSEFENKTYLNEETYVFLAMKNDICLAGLMVFINVNTAMSERPFGNELHTAKDFLVSLNLYDRPSSTIFRFVATTEAASLKIAPRLLALATEKAKTMGCNFLYSFIDGLARVRLYEKYCISIGCDFYHRDEIRIKLGEEYGGGDATFILVDFKNQQMTD